MDFVQLMIELLGMILLIARETMNGLMVMPANATGPLDSNITLTGQGLFVVCELAGAAVGLSNVLAEALGILI